VEVPVLPQKWFRVPTGTPPELERFVDDPRGFKGYVENVLESVPGAKEAQLALIEVFFEVGRPLAHVLVRNLDDPIAVKAVSRILGAEGFTELLTADQVDTAIGLERTIRPDPDSTSTS
jgi:hypothetical protein